ncbi:MAG: transposase [Alkalinema sp. CACIAM 70d]|nr:MAG: transposase [Alkalinema sp. CACIAM 70d]
MPLLYRQLQDQLRQWVEPKDQRHLQGFAEMLAAILQSSSACMGQWIPYLSHRDCQARAHLERFSYFLHNRQIGAEQFYEPMLQQVLAAFAGESVLLTLDTSVLWDQFCLIAVCLVWGRRSITLAQTVIEHGSASVGFNQYQSVLDCAQRVLPPQCQVTLLADRGFEHSKLIHWLRQHHWSWAIRAKSDLNITLSNGATQSVAQLLPPEG